MTRDQALKLVKEKIKTPNLINHCLAVEAVMKALAKTFNKDEEKWSLAGLLHDIDYEETKDNPKKHSLKGAQILKELGVDEDIVQAVKAHNEVHGLPRKTKIDKALYCADPITGLIVAATLVLPDKKLKSLKTKSVLKRFKEKSFAKGANRQAIASCQELGLSLEDFVKISLKSMQNISNKIGL
ncbi:MAG: HDIG domain-containing protein [Patescibacteria group bacterium]|nr:HDIG domain-containing protein [Patescibacteria group bacterium]